MWGVRAKKEVSARSMVQAQALYIPGNFPATKKYCSRFSEEC
jgi:hypothetical protein